MSLFFKSKNGLNYEIDKWFWVVHSTFLPTIFYLVLIFLALVGKTIILPLSNVIKKAGSVDKPHYLTANLFAFLGACSYGISELLNWYYK